MIEHDVVILLVAAGTYLSRYLPVRFNEKFRELKGFDEFLTYSSTALISALFVTSFVSFPVDLRNTGIGIVALAFVYASYRKWENLGFSVLTGVAVHLALSLICVSFFKI